MRLISTVVFIIVFAFPIFSQNNPTITKQTIKRALSKLNLKSSDRNMISDLMKENKLKHLDKNLKLPKRIKNRIKFIPIPPATFLNSQAELLPLHKPGDLIMKFVGKKYKK